MVTDAQGNKKALAGHLETYFVFVKNTKFKDESTWHIHENKDEMFFVVKGVLTVKADLLRLHNRHD